MKQKTLVTGSILAVAIVAIAICVGMVSGYSIFKPFISVDPIGDKNAGDSIILTGKTSLPAGTEILVQVYSASFESGSGTTTRSQNRHSKRRIFRGNRDRDCGQGDWKCEFLVNTS